MRAVLEALFNSDFFKEARYKRVKSPTEFVVGTVKLTGAHRFPQPGLVDLVSASEAMGQFLYNPPSVEGWHTGKEWIDAGTLNERVNFAVDRLGEPDSEAVREAVNVLSSGGEGPEPEEVVEQCLDQMGALQVQEDTRTALVDHAKSAGSLSFGTDAEKADSTARVKRLIQLIVSSTEYQFN